MKNLIFIIVFALFGGSVQAKDVGRWLCPECTIDGWRDGQRIPAADDIMAFIKGTVNNSAFEQIPGVVGPKEGWKPNDTITICNGSRCQTLIYHASGVHLALGGSYSDPRIGYKNAPRVIFGLNVGRTDQAYSVSVTGHFQWYDYYSEGVYTGSGELEWVIDSVEWTPLSGGISTNYLTEN